ncbi:chaperone NapD [Aliiroseovarius sp. PTFE2010]|uniref:chaperone NapD n=1 Tax=Aliiroseovarius sp. PTFE2010 TaxID=3417190 RepID=UPI003CF82E6F
MNICGCLVHVSSANRAAARDGIAALGGAEIHAEADDGRMVVVIEDTPDAYASDQIMALHQVPGVMSVTLNYHHFEPAPDPAQRSPLSSRRTDV